MLDILPDPSPMMRRFPIDVRLWKKCTFDWSKFPTAWKVVDLAAHCAKDVPKDPGVYAMFVSPIPSAGLPTSYLFYIGMSKGDIRGRFRSYIRDMEGKGKKRPLVLDWLKHYRGYVKFYFCADPVVLQGWPTVAKMEEELLWMFAPPANDQYPSGLGAWVTPAYRR